MLQVEKVGAFWENLWAKAGPNRASIDSSEKRIILDYQLTVLLADRTNGRAYATVLRLSSVVVCRLWSYVLWPNGAS